MCWGTITAKYQDSRVHFHSLQCKPALTAVIAFVRLDAMIAFVEVMLDNGSMQFNVSYEYIRYHY